MINIENAGNILVPYDFTAAGDAAISHANLFASSMKKQIVLFHVVPEYEAKEATMQKLAAVAEANNKLNLAPTYYTTATGTIFEQIGQAADILNSALIVMGTHGITGMQKITGSYALKVITNSHTPYIVVQQQPAPPNYNHIAIPIGFEPESKQPAFHIMNIARQFNSVCHLLISESSDAHINKKIKNNAAYCKNYFSDNNIQFKETFLNKVHDSFYDQVLHYSYQNKIDLITLMTPQKLTLVEFLLRPAEQYIIANKHGIPVMCIHPDLRATKYGSVFAS